MLQVFTADSKESLQILNICIYISSVLIHLSLLFQENYMYGCFAHCLCAQYVPGAHHGEKRVLNLTPELKLQMAVCYRVGAGNRAGVLWRTS